MKNGPGQAWGTAFSCLRGSLIGAGRNARSRAVTGVFGPGPRNMAVCHAIARPTHEYKNPLPLSQVRAGGRTWLVAGGRRDPWPAHKGPSFPPSPPSSPQRAFFRRMDGWCGAADCAPLMVPRYCGRGQWKIWRDARYFRGMQGVGRLWSGDGKRTTDVPRCAVLFRHAGRVISGAGEGGAPSDGLLVRGLGRLEKTRGEGEIFHRRRPEAAPGRARHDAVAPGIGSAMASPSPLVKELSSRSIPGRWPCP